MKWGQHHSATSVCPVPPCTAWHGLGVMQGRKLGAGKHGGNVALRRASTHGRAQSEFNDMHQSTLPRSYQGWAGAGWAACRYSCCFYVLLRIKYFRARRLAQAGRGGARCSSSAGCCAAACGCHRRPTPIALLAGGSSYSLGGAPRGNLISRCATRPGPARWRQPHRGRPAEVDAQPCSLA